MRQLRAALKAHRPSFLLGINSRGSSALTQLARIIRPTSTFLSGILVAIPSRYSHFLIRSAVTISSESAGKLSLVKHFGKSVQHFLSSFSI